MDILNEKIEGLVKKAEKSGMPYGILKKVYNRGMAAWRTGHRPGTTPQQWAMARVNSFVTKSSGTWGGADKDLAAKARGQKEEVEEAYKPVKNNHYDVKVTVSDREVDKVKSFIMNITLEQAAGAISDLAPETPRSQSNFFRVIDPTGRLRRPGLVGSGAHH